MVEDGESEAAVEEVLIEEGGETESQEPETADETPASADSGSDLDDSFASLREQARAAQERSDRFERELAQLRQEADQRNRVYEQVGLEERLAQLSPEERVDYKLNVALEEHRRLMAQQQVATSDATDKAEFLTKIARNSDFQKLAPQVEVELQAIRQARGWNFPREAVLMFLLGKQVYEGQASISAQRAKGKENVARQRAAPPQASSDVTKRDRAAKSLRERLENVVF